MSYQRFSCEECGMTGEHLAECPKAGSGGPHTAARWQDASRHRRSRPRKRLLVAAGILAVATAVGLVLGLAGIVHVRGWDWTAGSDSHYCYMFLPHWDAGCERVPSGPVIVRSGVQIIDQAGRCAPPATAVSCRYH
jgi:hypothetical protein